MAHDVFISYSSKDKTIADAVCATLEGARTRCWIAPRDVLPGLPYAEAIIEAIKASRVMVLVFSAGANESPQVTREVERAVSKGIPIIPFRIEAVPLSRSMEYFISSPHWLNALTPPLEKHLQLLAETVQLLLVRQGKRCDLGEGEVSTRPGRVVPGLSDDHDKVREAIPTSVQIGANGPAGAVPLARRRLLSARTGILLVLLGGVLAGLVWLVLHGREPKTAEPLKTQPPDFVSERDALLAIRDDLRLRPVGERAFQRYFSLASGAVDPSGNPASLRRRVRAAVAKLLNSLSWKKDLAALNVLGPDDTLLVVDLRELGWDQTDAFDQSIAWLEILKQYPYGLRLDDDPDLGPIAREVHELSGQDLAHIRADWFVAAATRPPLYSLLLNLPATQRELEEKLGINYATAFRANRLSRAGVFHSGVSPHHRVLDRIPIAQGSYWLSYEVASADGRRELGRYPLGPRLAEHPFPEAAFHHDGSTVLFSLPNGMQAYAVFDAGGKRLDAAGSDLLRDPQRTAGTSTVVSALSCIGCHAFGPVRVADDLRRQAKSTGAARSKLEQLVPGQKVLDTLFDEDENRYLRSLRTVTAPFLLQGEDRDRRLRDLPEPITAVSRIYQHDLTLAQASAELGLHDPSVLQECLRSHPKLREEGLAPLAEGLRIRRGIWDNLDDRIFSPFQDCAEVLERGRPHRVR